MQAGTTFPFLHPGGAAPYFSYDANKRLTKGAGIT
jgi:hypothetical protein